MYSTLPETSSGSLTSMVGIEVRRFLRHPLFLVGVLAAYGITLMLHATNDQEFFPDLLSLPVIPAFFIGMPSLIVAARLTRSTEVAVEATATAPSREARRTLAVAGACVVPFAAGVLWIVELLVLLRFTGPHENELWFGTVNDLQVWSILFAEAPVACLGAATLGVLVGRWLRFPGAPVVAVILLTVITMAGTLTMGYGDAGSFRLWAPWPMFHSGTMSDGEGWQGIPGYAQALLTGNPAVYLLYVLCLCALAVGGAVWHDRASRTPRLRITLWALVALAVCLFLLAATTGWQELVVSEPLPYE